MAKRTTPPSKKMQKPSDAPLGAADEAQAYRDDSLARPVPPDNLYDAIRAEVDAVGGVEFEPLRRLADREPPLAISMKIGSMTSFTKTNDRSRHQCCFRGDET
ncbi:MAG: hypothetical protein WDN08_18820 [Rhizomicrobium sp.]